MSRYRFITPHRTGKWYPDLETARRFACEIGAGFLDTRTGRFVAYVGTQLQVALGSGEVTMNANEVVEAA